MYYQAYCNRLICHNASRPYLPTSRIPRTPFYKGGFAKAMQKPLALLVDYVLAEVAQIGGSQAIFPNPRKLDHSTLPPSDAVQHSLRKDSSELELLNPSLPLIRQT